jgi:hypothetical protein
MINTTGDSIKRLKAEKRGDKKEQKSDCFSVQPVDKVYYKKSCTTRGSHP